MKVTESDFMKMTEHEKQSFLSESVSPSIISNMVSRGIIDTTKTEDPVYLRSVMSEHLRETIQSMEIITELDDDFILMAELSIEKGKYLPAIVLIATAIEHKINVFYRQVLSSDMISHDDITSIIRRIDFKSKIGWLLKLSAGIEIPKKLQIRIFSVIDLRNAIIHYKAVPSPIDKEDHKDSYAKIIGALEKIKIEETLKIVGDLEQFFKAELENIFPDSGVVEKVLETLNQSK